MGLKTQRMVGSDLVRAILWGFTQKSDHKTDLSDCQIVDICGQLSLRFASVRNLFVGYHIMFNLYDDPVTSDVFSQILANFSHSFTGKHIRKYKFDDSEIYEAVKVFLSKDDQFKQAFDFIVSVLETVNMAGPDFKRKAQEFGI